MISKNSLFARISAMGLVAVTLFNYPCSAIWAASQRPPPRDQAPERQLSGLGIRPSDVLQEKWKDIGDAKNVKLLAAAAGKLFAVDGKSKLLTRSPVLERENWHDLGYAPNIISLSGWRDELLAVTRDNRLLVRNVRKIGERWRDAGDAGDSVAISTARGIVFAATGANKLLARDIHSSSRWKAVGDSGSAVSMTNMGGLLLGLTNDGELLAREANSSNGVWRSVGNLPNIAALAAADGKMFALTKSGRLQYVLLPIPGSSHNIATKDLRVRQLTPAIQKLFTRQQTDRRNYANTAQKTLNDMAASYVDLDNATERQLAVDRVKKTKRQLRGFGKMTETATLIVLALRPSGIHPMGVASTGASDPQPHRPRVLPGASR